MRARLRVLLGCLWPCVGLGLPDCKHNDCPVCLDPQENTVNRSNLNFVVGGKDYSVPLRIARSNSHWATHMMLGQALGILAQERLGLNVEYLNCDDEIQCHLAIVGCSEWNQTSCTLLNMSNYEESVRRNAKVFNDPLPDIMVDLESWPEAQSEDNMNLPMEWKARPSIVVGSTGFVVRNEMYALPQTVNRAWRESGTVLGHHLAYTTDAAARYLVTPRYYMELGVEPEIQGCNLSLASGMAGLAAMNFSCNGSWWLSPACAALGDDWLDRCVAVLDDDWGYPKPDLYHSMVSSKMRTALLVLGYEKFYHVARDSGIENTTFLSWNRDTTFTHLQPVPVALSEVADMVITKLVWAPALSVNPKLRILLQQLSMDHKSIKDMLEHISVAVAAGHGPSEKEAPGYAQKVTCDWMRQHDVTWKSWLPSPATCMSGEEFVEARLMCVPCPEGKFWTGGDPQRPAICKDCDVGHYSAEARMTACTRCQPGFYQRNAGQSSCVACEQGRYQNSFGASQCKRCHQTAGFVTLQPGASSSSDCTCPPGTYWRRGNCSSPDGRMPACHGRCTACEPELDCPGGFLEPNQTEGFWIERLEASNPAEPGYMIWRCRDKTECPAGVAGGCAEGRTDRACHRCKDNFYISEKGTCAECGTGSVMYPAVLVAAGSVACVLLPFLSQRPHSTQRLSLLTITMNGGQLLATQAFASFDHAQVQWAEPVKTLLAWLRVVAFDFDAFRVTCLTGSCSPVVALVVQLAVCPCAVILICVGWSFSRCTSKPMSLAVLLNLVGGVLFTTYIGICIAMLLPIRCKGNPSPNVQKSMVSSPGIICWEGGDHSALVALSIVGFLAYPGTLISVAFWVTLTYPAQVAMGRGLKMSVQYNFLFGRFRTETYYYGCIFLLRNMALALVPVIVSDSAPLQLVILSWVVLINLCLSGTLWPWRTVRANFADQILSAWFILCMLSVAPMLEQKDSAALNALVFGIVASMMCAVGLLLLYSAYVRFRTPHHFSLFLCHHKAASGVLCRFMKMVVQRHSNCLVFIDSDALQSLDVLFDTVGCFTKNLVVVLTPQLFHRMWCAGEIATAHKHKVNIIPIVYGGFTSPSDGDIEAIDSVWTDEQVNMLLAYGIATNMVKDAYRHVLKLKFLEMPRFGTMKEQELVVMDVLSQCKLKRGKLLSLMPDEGLSETCRMFIMGNPSDPEAISTARVMQLLMHGLLHEEVTVLSTAREVEGLKGEGDKHMVVLLTRGVLRSADFAKMFLTFSGKSGVRHITTVNADVAFEFPSSEFYKDLECHGLGVPGLGPEQGVCLAGAYRCLMHVLAKPLTPLGSQGLIERQVLEICERCCPVGSAFEQGSSSRRWSRGMPMAKAIIDTRFSISMDNLLSRAGSRSSNMPPLASLEVDAAAEERAAFSSLSSAPSGEDVCEESQRWGRGDQWLLDDAASGGRPSTEEKTTDCLDLDSTESPPFTI